MEATLFKGFINFHFHKNIIMTKEEIIKAMNELALQHASSGDEVEDIKDSDWLESQAFYLIVDFCKKMNYQVGRFPNRIASENLGEDDITDEHWTLYVDILTLTNTDVADLHWHWASTFWPKEYENKDEFIDSISARITGEFYSVSL